MSMWLLMIVSYAASWLAVLVLIPQLFVTHDLNLLTRHDPETPFHATFALINQWSNGGVALFDRFDQMTLVFHHLSTGVYTLINALIAVAYIALGHVGTNTAENFYVFYIFGFHGLTMLLRTVGAVLIVRRLKVQGISAVLAVVMLNTVLSLTMYLGVLTNHLFSYLPLLLYFIWAFAEEFKFKYLVGALVVLTISVANSPLFALDYFYEVVHFFIVACVVVQLAQGHIVLGAQQVKQVKEALLKYWKKLLAVLLVCAVILLPWLMMSKMLKQDFYIASSGLGDTQGRLNNAFQPLNYFKDPQYKDVAYIEKFLFQSVDYMESNFEGWWPFLGGGILLLSMFAMVFSKNRAKWPFAIAIVLVLLSNTPVSPKLPWGLAHWVNALTNPFSFLIRTFHMPTLLLPFLFLPLVALGLQAVGALIMARTEAVHARRVRWLWPRLMLAMVAVSFQLYYYLKIYVLWVLWWGVVLLYAVNRLASPLLRCLLLAACVIGLLGGDMAAAAVYVRHYLRDEYLLQPRLRPSLDEQMPLLVEYQNPLHLPFREYLRQAPLEAEPLINSRQNIYGLYYKFTPLGRFKLEPSLYNPLPKVYQGMFQDTHTFPSEIIYAGTLVGGESLTIAQDASSRQRIEAAYAFDFNQIHRREQDNYVLYQWPLPQGFPSYAATALFTEDRQSLRLSIGQTALKPSQGKILGPWCFDVNNMRQGYLSVSLPTGTEIGESVSVTS